MLYLGAAGLSLDAEATVILDKVSELQPGGYPYGAFGAGQRSRWMQNGSKSAYLLRLL